MQFLKSNLFLFLASILFSLILGEIVLRAFTPFPIYTETANIIRHNKLGHVVDSRFSEIDNKGFRNEEANGEFDLVAMGDSFTYGYNVSSAESWPQQLGKLTGFRVYNYGIGGYGIVQHYFLLEEALKKKPKFIVMGLYLANDLRDVCSMISSFEHWREWARLRQINIRPCTEEPTPSLLKRENKKPDLSTLRVLGFRLIQIQ